MGDHDVISGRGLSAGGSGIGPLSGAGAGDAHANPPSSAMSGVGPLGGPSTTPHTPDPLHSGRGQSTHSVGHSHAGASQGSLAMTMTMVGTSAGSPAPGDEGSRAALRSSGGTRISPRGESRGHGAPTTGGEATKVHHGGSLLSEPSSSLSMPGVGGGGDGASRWEAHVPGQPGHGGSLDAGTSALSSLVDVRGSAASAGTGKHQTAPVEHGPVAGEAQ